jgi:hypothetical protein
MTIEPTELPALSCEAWFASERWLEHAARQLSRVLFWTDDDGLREKLKAEPRQRALRLVHEELKPIERAMTSLRSLLVHTRHSMVEFELFMSERCERAPTEDPFCRAVLAAEQALLSNSRIVCLCAEDLVRDTANWATRWGVPGSHILREGVEYSLDDFHGSVADSKNLGQQLNTALTSWFNRKRWLARQN